MGSKIALKVIQNIEDYPVTKNLVILNRRENTLKSKLTNGECH